MNSQFKFHLFCAVLVFSISSQIFRKISHLNVFGQQDIASLHLVFLFQFVSQQFITHQFCPLLFPAFRFLWICVFSTIVQFNCVATHRVQLRYDASHHPNFILFQHNTIDATFIFFSPKLSHFIPFLGIPIRTTQSHVVLVVLSFVLIHKNTTQMQKRIISLFAEISNLTNTKIERVCSIASLHRNDGTEHACVQSINHFHGPKSWLLSCSAACCADFLVVACLDREILGHTLLQLVRPFSEKSSRPQFPILVLEYFHRLKFFTNGMTLSVERVCVFENPCDSFPEIHMFYILCFIYQSFSVILSPNIPKLTHMLASPH